MAYSSASESTDLEVNQRLSIHPTVRLYAPNYANERWNLENLVAREQYILDPINALILLSFFEPAHVPEVLESLGEQVSCSPASILKRILFFREKNILVSENELESDTELKEIVAIINSWDTFDWREAADYYITTRDYPFIPQTKKGYAKSRECMLEYSESEFDSDRQKSYKTTTDYLILPQGTDLQNALEDVILSRNEHWSTRLELLIAVALGKTGEIRPQWNGAPLFLKTSPSGGCRHPTEGYLLLNACNKYPKGWYHVLSDPPALELIDTVIDFSTTLQECFPNSVERSPFSIKTMIVLTSVFERNMYRYREPRTFRTVHMDVGHVTATIELLGKALRLETFVQYAMNEEALSKQLRLDLLKEAPLVSVALTTC